MSDRFFYFINVLQSNFRSVKEKFPKSVGFFSSLLSPFNRHFFSFSFLRSFYQNIISIVEPIIEFNYVNVYTDDNVKVHFFSHCSPHSPITFLIMYAFYSWTKWGKKKKGPFVNDAWVWYLRCMFYKIKLLI